jgi:lipoyl(octanoyl) transferase
MNKVIFKDLKNISYQKAWDYQGELLKELVDRKRRNRNLPEEEHEKQHHYLLFCEHPHVYTLGKSGSIDNLLLSEQELEEKGIEFFKINRGGDITYHGTGQITGYPIFDLDCYFTDIKKYITYMEEAVIRTIAEYGIEGSRSDGESGVWLDVGKSSARKICAVGVHLSRWVTMHGFAFNVNTDLDYFKNIIPCGITDKGVTSLEKELGRALDMEEIKVKLKGHYKDLFGFEYAEKV